MKKIVAAIITIFTFPSIFASFIGFGFAFQEYDSVGFGKYPELVTPSDPSKSQRSAVATVFNISEDIGFFSVNTDITTIGKEYLGEVDLGYKRDNFFVGAEAFSHKSYVLDEVAFGGKVGITSDLGPFQLTMEGFARKYTTSNIHDHHNRENGFSCGLKAGLDYSGEHFNAGVDAGMESWQYLYKVSSVAPFLSFDPIAIRNTFNAYFNVEYNNTGIFVEFNYYCDHPECAWEWDLAPYQENINHMALVIGTFFSF